MKIIIFGTGVVYRRYATILRAQCDILAFIDNNEHINQGETYIDGYRVCKPKEIANFEYDKVVIASTYMAEMHQQLLSLGVSEDKIISSERLVSFFNRGQIEEISARKNDIFLKNKIIIITYSLDYDGGSMAAIYAAYALNMLGFDVTIGAPRIEQKIRNKLYSDGISQVIMPGVFYPGEYEKKYLLKYQIVIVNVYQNLPILTSIAKNIKCIWWIHECKSLIGQYYSEYQNLNMDSLKYVDIYAVSNVAKRDLLDYYPRLNIDILPCGIPDLFIKQKKTADHIVFAIIGAVSPIKGQDIMIDAIKIFNKASYIKNTAQFVFIGDVKNTSFSRKVKAESKSIDNVNFIGKLSRSQMIEQYNNIDVVVCSSREETLSLVIVEGMMLGKICIAPDKAGVSDYMTHGVDGFVYTAGDVEELANILISVAKNYRYMTDIRKNARKNYLKNFSMDCFANKLEEVISKNLRI